MWVTHTIPDTHQPGELVKASWKEWVLLADASGSRRWPENDSQWLGWDSSSSDMTVGLRHRSPTGIQSSHSAAPDVGWLPRCLIDPRRGSSPSQRCSGVGWLPRCLAPVLVVIRTLEQHPVASGGHTRVASSSDNPGAKEEDPRPPPPPLVTPSFTTYLRCTFCRRPTAVQ